MGRGILTTKTIIGKLSKDLSHLAVNFSQPKKDVIGIEIHHGSRKNVATLRTVRTHINNLIIGVTKGFKYKMRYVYAHFPINVNLDKNNETGNFEVEIRYVFMWFLRAYTSHQQRWWGRMRWLGTDVLTCLATETSLARSSSGESLCSPVLMSRSRRRRKMSWSY